MTKTDLSRRDFLVRAGLAGAGAALVLAGCGRGEKPGGQAKIAAGQEAAPAAGPPCDDLTGLTPAQIQVRATYEYVEKTPEPELACRLCEFYKEAPAGAGCGGCTLFAGPVNPDGSCNSFSSI